MSLFFKNSSLVEVIYLLIRLKKTKSFLWNTKSADRNGVNEQNTHITHREEDNLKKGLVSVSYTPSFLKQTPILPTPPTPVF